VARNRQRAKQRQAARRAERLGERAGDGAHAREHAQSAATPEAEAELEASAPPEELGRTDMVLEPAPDEPELAREPDLEQEEAEFEEEQFDEREADLDEDEEDALPAGKGHATPVQEADREQHRDRGKVLGFLANVWAELQRVQWPNRQQVTTLTGVVLGFVLIAGGYLGLLDAIFSRVIQAIL
jgi:preprotein translocase subunit SecE